MKSSGPDAKGVEVPSVCWSRLEMTEPSVVVTVENEFVLNGLASTEQVACCSNKHTQWPVLASQHYSH